MFFLLLGATDPATRASQTHSHLGEHPSDSPPLLDAFGVSILSISTSALPHADAVLMRKSRRLCKIHRINQVVQRLSF